MFLIIGSVVVLACVFGGYMASGGHLIVLFQAFRSPDHRRGGLGAFLIANSPAC